MGPKKYVPILLPTYLHGTYVHATFASNQGSIGSRYLCYEDIYIHKLTHRLSQSPSSNEIANGIVLKSVSKIFTHKIFFNSLKTL